MYKIFKSDKPDGIGILHGLADCVYDVIAIGFNLHDRHIQVLFNQIAGFAPAYENIDAFFCFSPCNHYPFT
ncbi:hypothetical protein SDC9_144871 [bioreactor metagenome]|uniref:Uncharacterized protein n=1 Tax=bioreactor metagenome TaxID=1076179 RepID=A0A645E766_9ZZZZ